MICRNCKATMERDDYMAPQNEGDPLDYDLKRRCPTAWYLCPECGFEAIWRKGQPLEVRNDPYDRESVAAFEYYI